MSTSKQTDAFDLAAFDTKAASEEGQEFEVQHPISGPTGFFIRMKGTHSEQVKAELKRITNRAKAARAGTVRKDDEQEGAKFLATVTLGWRSQGPDGKARPVTLGGVELPFNHENAQKVYTDYPLIAEQASRFVFDSVNFLKG